MTRFFIGNLAHALAESELAGGLRDLGLVAENIKIVVDRETGRPRGFGFADIEGDPSKIIGIADGATMRGRAISVRTAHAKNSRR